MEEAFAQHDLKHKDEVLTSTFGHLFPKGDYYEGTIVVAKAIYESQITILDEKIGIEPSPWWCETIHDFVHRLSDDVPDGSVYRYHIRVRVRRLKTGSKMSVALVSKERIYCRED